MLETLDAAAVHRWCVDGLAALKRHQRELDAINVYPVPDGDTGTNLVLTLTSAHQALALDLDNSPEGERTAHGHALRLMARGALLGARGNSGVIVSQILRGLADALADVAAIRGRELAAGLRAAAMAAYAAVARPVEGTLLTVVVAAARAAEEADTDDLGEVLQAAVFGSVRALAHTPEQLPVLARAGVVDAGGQGLCLILDALAGVVRGAPVGVLTEAPVGTIGSPDGTAGEVRLGTIGSPDGVVRSPAVDRGAAGVRETGSVDYAYEVQVLLDAEVAAVDRLRAVLAGLGDSLVMVADGAPGSDRRSTWNVHVHVNDVGAAVEAAVVAGRPYRISVTRFADGPAGPAGAPPLGTPVGRPGAGREAAHRPMVPSPAGAEPERAAVVVAGGPGLAALFAAEGAAVVASRPAVADLLAAIRSTGSRQVVVLPNDPDTRAVAAAAADEAYRLGVRVSVVPTRSPVQALAALAVRDPGRRFDDDVIAMAEAAGACRSAEICRAARDALTVAGPCRAGDLLGLVEGEVHLIGTGLPEVCVALLDRLLGGGGELATLLFGAEAPNGLAEAVQAHLADRWPFVEVHTYHGGQPAHPLVVGVE